MRDPQQAFCGSLVYVSTPEQLAEALTRQPAIMILSSQLAGSFVAPPDCETCCFSVHNISMGMALLLVPVHLRTSRNFSR